MRLVRFLLDGEPRFGEEEAGEVFELSGAPWDGARRTGRAIPADEARLLAPCRPGKVLAVGLNYRSHLGERPEPVEPGMFAKMPTSIIGPGDDIVIPPGASEVHYEGELVIVIGRRARRVAPAEARSHILGVTAGNDVSERRWQREDLQWLRAKGSDTFGPLGPAIVTDLDPADLAIETRLNGETVQSARTRDLLFPVEEIVSFASRFVTLEPGDVIFTGTPGTTSPIAPGDVVEVQIEGIGTLRNPVAATG